ncbi:uncharacterized protein [Venturia canescens]|uniref:uncharacterized protein n=1 Tax=Venturia canescens TaxID=32260 RepID=UPI001C9C680B|nr:uncharacterized protein LOC122418311 [Venturia canescens]
MVKRLFYTVSALLQKVMHIDIVLNTTDVASLQKFAEEAKENATHFQHTDEILLDEDTILHKYADAFQSFQKKAFNLPHFPCLSCQKLCCLTDVRKLDNLRVVPVGKIWEDLKLFIASHKDCDSEYICQYCLTKLRAGVIPPTCVLNNLYVRPTPTPLKDLNEFEKILIQRAKVFQTVVKMGTVHKKNIPHRKMLVKAQGRAFHLPLPLEKTLEKICPPTKAINSDHELYILVRGVPTKSKKVWESIVNKEKVFRALLTLKERNILYGEINLPERYSDLLDTDLRETEFQISQECDSDEDVDNPDTQLAGREKQKEQGDGVQKISVNKQIDGRAAALLTQMTPSDCYYEQYTIQRMHAPKENKTATELYQMLKVHAEPLDNRYKLLDFLCFPCEYPDGVNGEYEERPVHLSSFEYAKVRILSRNNQFRLNQQYLFFLLNAQTIRQLSSGIYHKLNVTDGRVRYTSASYLDQLGKGELEGNLSTIFSKLPNTEQYWKKPRNDLNCMLFYYGPPTWFFTLSPSEWQWDRLTEFLRERNPSVGSGKSVSELISADPISAAIFIENEFKAMLKFLQSDDHPIGKIIHYVIRREYQGRGMIHFHFLIWIEGAPILGKNSKEEVADFIKTYITCKIPNPNVSPMLYRRVTTHQYHHHNSYCMRSKSVGVKGKGGSRKVCRFAFPKPVTNDWIIRDVQTSIAGRRKLKSKCQLYDNPRSLDEVNINNYNPAVLTAWEGNMDISFVGEKSSALAWYLTKYMSKSEQTHVGESFEQINNTKSVASRLWNIGLRALNHRECGALEAADRLLGYPLFMTDPETVIRWVDINIVRSRRVKPRKVIETMNAESTDIFYEGLIENYPNRPTELNDVCLYDYAKWYDIVKAMPQRKDVVFYKLKPGSYLRKRERGYLINHYHYDPMTNSENYFHSLLLLFQPWRCVAELKNGEETYTASYFSVHAKLPMAAEYHERLAEIAKNTKEMKELIQQKIDEMEKDQENHPVSDNIPRGCDPIEADEAMKDFVNLGANEAHKELNITEMIAELNEDQKRVFDLVTSTMNSDEILRLYVSGEGGTGKSFLIKTITCWLKQIKGKDSAVTAPTGIAAFNIDGLTLHRLFQLPVEHNKTPKYKELSDAALEVIRVNLKNVDLIIIDEISMVSNITLMYIHLRLTEIFNTTDVEDGWFGKKHIIVFGDLLQLPPVREEPAFIKLSKEKVEKLIGSLCSTNLWGNLFKYDELSINMRQKNDSS